MREEWLLLESRKPQPEQLALVFSSRRTTNPAFASACPWSYTKKMFKSKDWRGCQWWNCIGKIAEENPGAMLCCLRV